MTYYSTSIIVYSILHLLYYTSINVSIYLYYDIVIHGIGNCLGDCLGNCLGINLSKFCSSL